jgi:membrane fusion protein (multidrug efflux system)
MPQKNLFSIVNDEQKWIIANYRETQRKHIHIGSKVDIHIDAFPDYTFEGEVSAISNATGSQYSLIAQDNSSGNFVKVEQRIPVKIMFTQNNDSELLSQLGAGLNAECKVVY